MNQLLGRPACGVAPRLILLIRVLSATGLLLAIATALVTTMRSPLKDDIAWLLYVAQQWMGGRRLYVDLVEVNPPLIIWICAVPVRLAALLGTSPKFVAMPFFCTIIVGCAAWATAIVSQAKARIGDPVVVLAACTVILLLIPAGEFGQREHLLMAAALPYLVVVGRELAGDAPGTATAILAGIVAALGCALKPRYLMAFGIVEIFAAWQGVRILRPVTWAAAATLVVYALAVLAFEPAFFRMAMPMAFALYGASDVPFLDLLFDCRLLVFSLAVGFLLLTTQPVNDARGKLVASLLVFAAGATIVCLIDGKNWFYHRLPGTIAAILGLVGWAALRVRSDWRPGWRRLGPAMLAVVVLAAFGLRAYERLRPQVTEALAQRQTTEARLAALLTREHAKSYVAFSDWIALGFPVVNNTGVVWASRFDSMWAIDGELWRAARDGRPPHDWPMRRWVSADFITTCPDIVVVDRRSKSLDYVELLKEADPSFLLVWRHYLPIAAFHGLIVFRRSGDVRGDGCGPTSTKLAKQPPALGKLHTGQRRG